MDRALEQCLERTRHLEAPASSDSESLTQLLERLEKGLSRLENFLHQAEAEAAQAEAPLAEDVQALEQWLNRWAQVRQQMTRLPGASAG
jgi:hypothetical protein